VFSCGCLSEEVVLPVLDLVGPRGEPVAHELLHMFDRNHGSRVLTVRILANLLDVSGRRWLAEEQDDR